MTCERFKDRVGYKGQKYRVMAELDGVTTRIGWSQSSDLKYWRALAEVWRLKNIRVEEVTDKDNES